MEEPSLPKKSFELPIYITLTLKFLSFIAPPLALHLALKLFYTPLKFKIPNREIPTRNKAIKQLLKTSSGEGFTLYEWKGSGPTALLVHGWSGRGSQFFKIIETLTEKGFHVLAIDAPAHGNSDKKKTNLIEFVECVEEVGKIYGVIEVGIGHSLGGAALFNALDRSVQINQLILIGSPSSIEGVINDFCEKVKAGKNVARGIYKHIEKNFHVDINKISIDYLAAKHQPEGMIIHDTEDRDISVDYALTLSKTWTNAELLITEGLGHRRVLMDKKVINRIMNFLTQHETIS